MQREREFGRAKLGRGRRKEANWESENGSQKRRSKRLSSLLVRLPSYYYLPSIRRHALKKENVGKGSSYSL